MWLRIALKNYRSIESAEVELAPFTVLVGPNGSGKTNFVDALVLSSELGVDAASAVERRGGLGAIRRWGVGEDDTLQVRVRASESREALASRYIEQSFSMASEEGSRWSFLHETFESVNLGKRALQFTREGGRAGGEQGGSLGFPYLPPTTSIMLYARQMVPWDVIDVHRLRLDLAVMTAPQPPGAAGQLQENGRNIASVLERLRSQDRRAFDFVLMSMRRLIPGLEDIFVEEAGGFLILRFSQRQPSGVAHFAAANMSEGALRALGIIVAAQTLSSVGQPAPAQMLIVEEPEVAIHPGAAALLFEVLKLASQRSSVLVTTHSPELLEAAQDEEILVCGYRNGTTRLGPLSMAQREVVREGLLSLSELARSEPLRIEGEEPESLDPRDLT